ncbi:SRPBCC family protein [Oryzobacter telluris]|uniref:SRPBCC family protein n=1 Tax=Oryzobacter telluris TaxID=3149179 RepID=UPI00370D5FE0
MDVDVTLEADIRRPRAEVAAFASDPANVPAWYANIRSVEVLTPGPLEVGSRMRFVARFLGRTITYTYEVRELVPGERLVMATASGPFPMTTTYAFADLPTGSTRMTMRNHGSPSGFGAVAAPVMARAMERAMTKDLRRLTAVLEAR